MANRTKISRRRPTFLLLTFAAATLLAALLAIIPASRASDKAKPKPPLENFYVVTQAIFRNDPKWVDHILDVHPQGADVFVREIRIAPLASACPHHVTVRAVERVVPNTTVKKLAAKFDLCAYVEDDVEGVITAAKRKNNSSVEDDSATQTIVAHCGPMKKLFELPDEDSLRFEALSIADARLATFWQLASAMEGRVFGGVYGSDFSLAKVSPEQDHEFQAFGAKVIPEIKSGKYDEGFADNPCPFGECHDHNAASALQGYSGPIFSCPEN